MARFSKLGRAAFAMAVLIGGTAATQDSDGWDFSANASQDLMTASVEYASGHAVIVQCHAGNLVVGVAGTPLTGAAFRPTILEREGDIAREAYWQSAPDAPMATTDSMRVARYLRDGGRVLLRSRDEDEAPFQVHLDLPSSGEAVDQVLTQCGAPLTDDRDDLPFVGALLVDRPALEMPMGAIRRGNGPQAVEVSCLIRDGRLAECRSDRQTPMNPRAGEMTANEANGTRVRLTDVAAAEGLLLEVTVTGFWVR